MAEARPEGDLVIAIAPLRRSLAAVLVSACAFAAVGGTAAEALAATPDMPSSPSGTARLTAAQRTVLLDATRRFRDVRRAIRAGYLPTKDCVPGMGFHYVKPALAADNNIDPVLPEILVYNLDAHGKLRLSALEYFRADADQRLRTDQDRPTLFGRPFNGPMNGHPVPPGQPPMPVHYDLHVWLYQHNPSGELATTNPQVACR
ncbi:hypothetical protein ACFQS1_10865 [Paractinoplanes rhizophilus]|uniref:Uncharacterized protein n=1 Tax=Paractinoplanes rhizophilus TaxID=1416877 RepID=A0ABW2HMP5_9ACTN